MPGETGPSAPAPKPEAVESPVAVLERSSDLPQQLPHPGERVPDQSLENVVRSNTLIPETPDLGGRRSDADLREVITGEIVEHKADKQVEDKVPEIERAFWRRDKKTEEINPSQVGIVQAAEPEAVSLEPELGSPPPPLIPAPPGDGGDGEGPPRGPENDFIPEYREDGTNWALEYTRRAAEIFAIEDPVERERREGEFIGYIRILDRMSANKQFFGVGIEAMRIEQRLVDFEDETITNITGDQVSAEGNVLTAEQRKLILRDLLDRLEGLEHVEKGYDGALKVFEGVDLPSLPLGERSEFNRRTEGLAATQRELQETERQITNISGDPNFVAKRRELKKEIYGGDGEEGELDQLNKRKKLEENYSAELKDEGPSDFERQLEILFMKEGSLALEITRIETIPDYASLRNLGEDKTITIEGVNPGDPPREVTVKELKEWYFVEARKKGFFDLVDSQLASTFIEMRASVTDVSKNIPEGLLTRHLREALSSKTEHEGYISWDIEAANLEVKDGITAEQAKAYVSRFYGVKEDFIRTGYRQIGQVINILNAIRKIDKDRKMSQADRFTQKALQQQQLAIVFEAIKNTRLLGGFDITELELNLGIEEEEKEQAVGDRPYEYQWSRYILKGVNRDQIEFSANAAVDDLLAGAASFDVQSLMQRMNALSEAVKEFGTPVHISEDDIRYLQRSVVNRISFHLGQWFGILVQMDSAAAVTSNWANNDGYDRLRAIPTMIGGLVGKAIKLRYSPEYKFSKRLEGWNGILSKNQLTQRFIRGNFEEILVDDLMRYELVGNTDQEKYATRMSLHERKTEETFDQSFVILKEHPKETLERARETYFGFLEHVRLVSKPDMALLNKIKEARQIYNRARRNYNRTRRDAKAAAEFSGMVMDFFMESARIGAPSIRMENRMRVRRPGGEPEPDRIDINGRTVEIKGDDMSIDDITSILEYVVMQEAKKIGGELRGQGYNLDDNGALIRWRSRRFLQNGATENKSDVVKLRKTDGTEQDVNILKLFKLRKGFEYTGLDEREFLKLVETFKKLKAGGYKAEINGKKVPEILKEMQALRPVLNHYIGEDLQGIDYLLHAILDKESKRGRQPFIASLLDRLKWFGLDDVREKLPSLTVSQQREQMEQVLENSRSFHDTITEMVYYLGTRSNVDQVLIENNYMSVTHNLSLPDNNVDGQYNVKGIYADLTHFDTTDFIFGFPNITLGHKRIKYLNANWMLRKQERVARGITMLPFMRIYMPSLSEDLGGKDLLEVIWNMDKDYFDMPWLMNWAARMKNAVDFRKRGETSINAENLKTEWGFWDKLLSDAERLWALFPNPEEFRQYVEGKKSLPADTAEKLMGTMEEILTRFLPMLNLMDKSLSYDREAAGSGAADESNQKVALKFLGWLLSVGGASRRLQGGGLAHADAEAILKFILERSSYRKKFEDQQLSNIIHLDDKSVWERLWEKIKPRTPGISFVPPVPFYARAA